MIAYKFLRAGGMHDLPVWLGVELWAVELDGKVVRHRTKLVAQRGRLVERVSGWDDETARELARACAAPHVSTRGRCLAAAVAGPDSVGTPTRLRAPDVSTTFSSRAERWVERLMPWRFAGSSLPPYTG